MKRDAAFQVVADFEAALSEYTGAPHVVTTDSCTNALYLCFRWCVKQNPPPDHIEAASIPRHTYVGVVQAARWAGHPYKLDTRTWEKAYWILNTPIRDSAKHFQRNMWTDLQPNKGALVCLSFQAGKHLPIGRGGATLTDNPDAADWLRKARLDGRTPGADYADNTYQGFGAHCYLPPDAAARGLWLMTYLEDDDPCDWTAYPDLSEATWT